VAGLTERLGITEEDARFLIIDGQVRRHLTRVAGTAIVIQAMMRGLDREWATEHGAGRGDALSARVSDARRILRGHGVTTGLPAHPSEQREIWSLLRRLQSLPQGS
jgi:hypothetical protein